MYHATPKSHRQGTLLECAGLTALWRCAGAENRAIQPDGEGFQDEFKKLDLRMYELE